MNLMRLACLALVLGVLVLALPGWAPLGWATGRDTPIGRWLTQDKEAVIAIEPCSSGLCGRIVGVTLDHPDDPLPTDHDGHSQCGLTIIRSAVPDGDQGWKARITDPRDGKIYQARMRIDEQHRLRVRGYVGIPLIGRTEFWTPFLADIGADCRLPAL